MPVAGIMNAPKNFNRVDKNNFYIGTNFHFPGILWISWFWSRDSSRLGGWRAHGIATQYWERNYGHCSGTSPTSDSSYWRLLTNQKKLPWDIQEVTKMLTDRTLCDFKFGLNTEKKNKKAGRYIEIDLWLLYMYWSDRTWVSKGAGKGEVGPERVNW